MVGRLAIQYLTDSKMFTLEINSCIINKNDTLETFLWVHILNVWHIYCGMLWVVIYASIFINKKRGQILNSNLMSIFVTYFYFCGIQALFLPVYHRFLNDILLMHTDIATGGQSTFYLYMWLWMSLLFLRLIHSFTDICIYIFFLTWKFHLHAIFIAEN